jgi:hypothetical protein
MLSGHHIDVAWLRPVSVGYRLMHATYAAYTLHGRDRQHATPQPPLGPPTHACVVFLLAGGVTRHRVDRGFRSTDSSSATSPCTRAPSSDRSRQNEAAFPQPRRCLSRLSRSSARLPWPAVFAPGGRRHRPLSLWLRLIQLLPPVQRVPRC